MKKTIFKIIFILISIILLIIYPANAEYKERVYEGYVLSGDSVKITNTTFTISFSTTDKIAVSISDSTGLVIKNGLCEIKGLFEICFLEANFSHHNYATDRDIYKAKIRLNEYLAKLEIKKESSHTKASLDDEITITNTINNIGSITAANISLIDEIPEEFIITGLNGCYSVENKTVLDGNLDIDSQKTCIYKLRPKKSATLNSKSSLTYFNGKDAIKISSPTIKITVQPYPLGTVINLSKEPNIQEPFNAIITLINNDSENEIRILSLDIEIPDALEIATLPSRLRQDYKKFTWTGNIEPSESTAFTIELMPKRYGKYTLKADIIYLTKGKRLEIKNTKEIYINPPGKSFSSIPSQQNISNKTEKIEPEPKSKNLSIEKGSSEITNLSVHIETNETATIINFSPEPKPKKLPKIPLIALIISIPLIILVISIKIKQKREIKQLIEKASKKLKEEIIKKKDAKLEPKNQVSIKADELIKTGIDESEKSKEQSNEETAEEIKPIEKEKKERKKEEFKNLEGGEFRF